MAKVKSSAVEKTPDYLTREILAAILFAFGLFSSLSLIFYSTESGLDVKGTMGTTGVFISEILGKAFGISSFIIPIVMFYTAVLVFVNKSSLNLYRKAISAFIFLFATTTIIGMIFKNQSILGYEPPGGWIGNILSSTLREKAAGAVGSYLILTILILLSVVVLSNLSLSQILHLSGKIILFISETTTSILKYLIRECRSVFEWLFALFQQEDPENNLSTKHKTLSDSYINIKRIPC